MLRVYSLLSDGSFVLSTYQRPEYEANLMADILR